MIEYYYNEASAKVKRLVEESFRRHEADYKIKKDEDSAARLAKRILEELIENKVVVSKTQARALVGTILRKKGIRLPRMLMDGGSERHILTDMSLLKLATNKRSVNIEVEGVSGIVECYYICDIGCFLDVLVMPGGSTNIISKDQLQLDCNISSYRSSI